KHAISLCVPVKDPPIGTMRFFNMSRRKGVAMRADRERVKLRANRRRRWTSPLQGVEHLESRNLMTVALSNVHLSTDTGSSSTDKISSKAAIGGAATRNPTPFGSMQVQFDHNDNGTGDGWSNISNGSFS